MDKSLWGLEGSGACGAVGIGTGGGAFPYSRRGLRLRRRGAYGIHRASGPRCQGLCRKVASLRSGGRRLAVGIAMENHIGAMPRTPFPASREFPSRGNKKFEEKNRGVICFMYYSSIPPLWWLAPPPCPVGSVSLDSQSPTAPCESSSLATRWEACHWIRGSRGSPMNPVPLPPPQFGGAAKGKRLNGQARRLTSPHLEVLCRTSTGDYKAPLCCELLMKGLLFRALFCPLNRGKSGEAG